VRFSDTITKVSAAIFSVQQTVEPVAQGSTNQNYNSTYANLGDIWAAIKPLAKEAGLVVTQGGSQSSIKGTIVVETTVIHVESGEWISSDMTFPLLLDDPQKAGSAITYARRYLLGAIFGIITEKDDDGNSASGKPTKPQRSLPIEEEPAKPAAKPVATKPAPSGVAPSSAGMDSHGIRVKVTKLIMDAKAAILGNPSARKTEEDKIRKYREMFRSRNATGQLSDADKTVLEDLCKEALDEG